MKLIVGLGNPGKEYENTRHNVGFMMIDYYAKNLTFKEKFNGLYANFDVENEKIILLKPQSYMNNSGDVVQKFLNYYKIDIKDMIVIYDDVDFNIGSFKIKKSGSSGGHNGINDIIKKINSNNINRIRIGIGKNNIDLVNYVLGKFTNDEKSKLTEVFSILENVINDFFWYDIDKIMTKYNRKENE